VSIERKLLISTLKLTKKSDGLFEDVKNEAKLPAEVCWQLLHKMQKEELVNLCNEKINVTVENRIKLAVKAVNLGADLQTVSDLLCWQEFEEIAAYALKSNGYTVVRNLRFKHGTRRFEVDVVGCRKPLVVCIDCKRWQHSIGQSALRKIVEDQTRRVEALADSLPNPKVNLECSKWDFAKFVPAVLSLMPGVFRFYYDVPVVSVLQLQDFICQLPLYTENMKYIPKKFAKLSHGS
jgi:Holliday junction resolvase-like predicted endonuclease